MTAITVPLSDETLSHLRLEAQRRGFASTEEMVRSLVDAELRDTASANQVRLEAELVRRLESNEFVDMDDADFRAIRADVAAAIAKRRSP